MPTDPQLTVQEIFHQALLRNDELHKQALADLQRRTDEVHDHMRGLTQQYMARIRLPDFSYVQTAVNLDPDFWADTVERAKVVLRTHGVLPAEEQPNEEPPADPQA